MAQVGQLYSFDLSSPNEGNSGVTYSLVNAPAGMTINSQTGVISWTPAANQMQPASFEVAVSDAAGNISTQDVDITVLGELPALPDAYTTNEDTTLTVSAANGVLDNDGDENSGTLAATLVTQPTNGTLTLNANGSFTYVPNANFFGTDTFTYRASDDNDESNVALVTITVNAVNDAPTGVPNSYTVNEDATLNVNAASGVLTNDSDVDPNTTLAATVATQPSHGTLTLNANGSFTYVITGDRVHHRQWRQ
jgi:VCBS repeat-containing protein